MLVRLCASITAVLLGLLGLLAPACSQDSPRERLAACSDLSCQADALVALAQQDPNAATTYLVQVTDPLAQVALVTALGGAQPTLLTDICTQLSAPASQRCQRFVMRPHLNNPDIVRPDPIPRSGGGPAGRLLPVPRWLAVPARARDSETVSETCDGAFDCTTQAARDAAMTQDLVGAQAACTAAQRVSSGPSDCRFEAAEAAVSRAGADGLATAVPLCAGSPHAADCLSHVITIAAPPPSPSDRPSAAAAQALADTTAKLKLALGDDAVGRQAGELAADFLLASWIETAVQAAATPTGDLLDLLPPQAAPHLRYSIARVLLLDAQNLDLDAVADRVNAAMARRAQPATDTAQPLFPITTPQLRGYAWADDLPGESDTPAIFALGGTRRATVDDARIDARLAVLEALFQQKQLPRSTWWLAIVADSKRSDIERWSAARIAGEDHPEALRQWIHQHADLVERAGPLLSLRLAPPVRPPEGAPPDQQQPDRPGPGRRAQRSPLHPPASADRHAPPQPSDRPKVRPGRRGG